MLVLISALIIDAVTSNIYNLISKEIDSIWGVTYFISISAVILVVGLVLLLGVIKEQSKHLRRTNSNFNKIYRLVVAVQFLIIAVFLFMIIQMVLTSQYFVTELIITSIVGSIPFYISLGLLAHRFFLWYRSSKQNIIVFLYGLAIVFMLIGNATLDTGVVSAFLDAPEIKKASAMQFQDDSSINNSTHLMTMFSATFLRLAMVLLTISYIFLWIVSAILLYGYSRRLGKSTTYWMVIFLPPVFLLLGLFPSLLGIPNANFSFIEQDADLFRILATLAIIVGGLLFGVSFFVLARSMRRVRQGPIADYLNIAGYGIALLPLPILANILFIPYPPIGSATCSALALASYVFSVGIYSSAISISEDAELRKSIRKTAVNELKLLDSIGTAQMSAQLQGEVAKLVKEHSDTMVNEVGVQSNLTVEDAKEYLDEVIEELNKHRSSK